MLLSRLTEPSKVLSEFPYCLQIAGTSQIGLLSSPQSVDYIIVVDKAWIVQMPVEL